MVVDAKTNRDLTRLRSKISFKTVLTDPLEMPIISTRSLIVNRRFLSTKSLISMTCCSSVDVFYRQGRSFSSTHSLPSLNIYATRMLFFSIDPGHQRPSATSSTFLQQKFHSAHKI